MARSRVNVTISGPLFDGTTERLTTQWLDETKKDVADLGVLTIKEQAVKFDRSGRATGHYMSVINTRQVSPYNDQLINDGGIVYGPWLEGESRRNRSTRFKGYHAFRKTRSRLKKQYAQIAQRKLEEFITRMGEPAVTFNAAAVTALFSAVRSHAASTGLFEQVPQHEPKSAPGGGLSCAIWVDSIEPVLSSGLAQTSGRVVFNIRVYSNMLAEPQDGIDPRVLSAVCTLMAEYSGAFTLGGSVREIDLLGEHGDSLSAKAGYLSHDSKLFRVLDIVLPVIINDLFTQAA